jgi:hypothetical protein
MTIKEYLDSKTTEELITELEGLEQQIDDIGCFGTKDLRLRYAIEDELDARNWEEKDEDLD